MSAVISPCGVYRYRLERTIRLQQGPVYAYFGVNGSTATATEDDHTKPRSCNVTTNTEFNAAVSGGTDEKQFRDMLLPALIFYVAFTAMFVIFDITIAKEPFADNHPFLPFLLAIANFARDARKEWGWWNGIKVVSFITALAVSTTAIYQIVMDTVDVKMLVLYPSSAVALMVGSWLVRVLGRTPPFQLLGRHLSCLGAAKWFQRTIAFVLIPGAIAITVYAFYAY